MNKWLKFVLRSICVVALILSFSFLTTACTEQPVETTTKPSATELANNLDYASTKTDFYSLSSAEMPLLVVDKITPSIPPAVQNLINTGSVIRITHTVPYKDRSKGIQSNCSGLKKDNKILTVSHCDVKNPNFITKGGDEYDQIIDLTTSESSVGNIDLVSDGDLVYILSADTDINQTQGVIPAKVVKEVKCSNVVNLITLLPATYGEEKIKGVSGAAVVINNGSFFSSISKGQIVNNRVYFAAVTGPVTCSND